MQDIFLYRLLCGINSKAWGKIGRESLAARFAQETAPELSIEQDKTYAELWMGTYPSSQSKDFASGVSLGDLISAKPNLLSASFIAKYGSSLPFLFKVLSIGRPLSIQAHPNKQLAEQLHASQPETYPDDNHKPEMVIAISDFEGLCGLRPLNEVVHFLKSVPALRRLVGEDETQRCFEADAEDILADAQQWRTKAIRSAFAKVLKSKEDSVTSAAKLLVEDASVNGVGFAAGGVSSTSGAILSELVLRLDKHFHGDAGLFAIFFLKYIHLSPGEAIFLKADTIHAHLSGNIIECMAASDNVVRAGLTPNFKDINTFVQVLDFAVVEDLQVCPISYNRATMNHMARISGSHVKLYNPSVEEFSVVRSALIGHGAEAMFDPIDGPCVIICTAGSGQVSVGVAVEEMREGSVYFLGAGSAMTLRSDAGDGQEFTTFVAFCEVNEP